MNRKDWVAYRFMFSGCAVQEGVRAFASGEPAYGAVMWGIALALCIWGHRGLGQVVQLDEIKAGGTD